MSQTEDTNQTAAGGEVEEIRKVYARDVKPGDQVHTVFKTTGKERHTSRAGKTFLAFALYDKTGAIDGRAFDAVDTMEKAFVNDDYLLVKGKVITFHGKPQLVVDSLERLDPEPIDAKEFGSPPPAPEPKPEKPEKPERAERAERPERDASAAGATGAIGAAPRGQGASRQLRQRVLSLLDDPEIANGLAALVRHLEQYIDDRVSGKPATTERHERPERNRHDEPRKARGPRPAVEHRPKVEGAESKPEPKRDPGLPKELAFKPFSALVPPAEETPAAAPEAPKES